MPIVKYILKYSLVLLFCLAFFSSNNLKAVSSYTVHSASDWQQIMQRIQMNRVDSAIIFIERKTNVMRLDFDIESLQYLSIRSKSSLITIETAQLLISDHIHFSSYQVHFDARKWNSAEAFLNVINFQGKISFQHSVISLNNQFFWLAGFGGTGVIECNEFSFHQRSASEKSSFSLSGFGLVTIAKSKFTTNQLHFEKIEKLIISKSNLALTRDLVIIENEKVITNGNTFNFISGGLCVSSQNAVIGEKNKSNTTSNLIVVNNMISSATGVAVSMEGINEVFFVHNSLRGRTAISADQLQNATIKNNIFYATVGLAFEIAGLIHNTDLDFNIYYSETGLLSKVGRQVWEKLTHWQSTHPTINANSFWGNPGFVNHTDLHIEGILPNDKGDNSVGIDIDFDGDIRPMPLGTAVDIGADEFQPPILDAALTLLFLNEIGNCQLGTLGLFAVVENFGTTTIPSGTSIEIQLFNGIQTITITNGLLNSIPTGGKDTIFVYTIQETSGAILNVTGQVLITADQRPSNNHYGATLSIPQLVPQVVDSLKVCKNSKTISIAAAPPNHYPILWFGNAADSIPLQTGQIGVFDSLDYSTTTAIYAAFVSIPKSLSTPLTGKDSIQTSNFSVLPKTNVFITDLSVLPIESGWSLINIFVRKNSAAPWQLLYSQNDLLSANQERKFILSTPYGIKANEMAQFRISTISGARIRGTVDANNIDSSIENIDLIILQTGGTSLGTNPNLVSGVFNGRVGYLKEPCQHLRSKTSLILVEDTVYASFTTSTQFDGTILFDASASIGSRFVWDFGDGSSANGRQVTHHYFDNNEYFVTLSVYSDGCDKSQMISQSVAGVLSTDENLFDSLILVYPNPTTDIVQLSVMPLFNSSPIGVDVINILGELVLSVRFEGSEKTKSLRLDSLSNGIYFLKVTTATGVVSLQKIIKK